MKVAQPLPLDSVWNARDLGGYPISGGGTTAFHRFLRSATLHQASPEDQQALYDYGVRLVVDLRSLFELEDAPNPMVGFRDVAYCNVPLDDEIQAEGLEGHFPDNMGEMYVRLLDHNQDAMARVLTGLVACQGCALFHCTAGKDRTGVIAMLLLDAAGVEEDTIIADYAATEGYMEGMFAVQRAMLDRMGVSYPESIFQSRPAFMRLALDHLRAQYGTALDYFRAIGLAEQTVKQLVSRLQG